MKKLSIALAFSLFALCASAQTMHQKTLQLFKLMELDKMMSSMTDNMMNVYGRQNDLFKDPKKMQEFRAFVKSEMTTFGQKVTDEMVPAYEKYFTETEIQKYIDFYSTPEGKKLIESGPVFQKQMMATMLKNDMPGLQRKIQAKITELQAKK